MDTINESKQKAIDYAKHFPVVLKDSPYLGPVSVGNVGAHNGRTIINLCLRTAKSGERNATISFPSDWAKASQFQPGDQVNVKIEDGYVKNIWAAKPERIRHSVSAAAVNQQITEAIEKMQSRAVTSCLFLSPNFNNMTKSLFHTANQQIASTNKRFHLHQPITPYKIAVDEQARLLVFMTKREYMDYLDTRDVELCRY
jgi:hypothetical protein